MSSDDLEVAPAHCIVCLKHPSGPHGTGWTYISGAYPLGSMACSKKCLEIALHRYSVTGRTDLPLESEDTNKLLIRIKRPS